MSQYDHSPADGRPSADGTVGPARLQRLVEAVDGDGREVLLTQQEFRAGLLPERIAISWNLPDALFATIEWAIEEGCADAVVEAAVRLRAIDPDDERGVGTYVHVLLEAGHPDLAKAQIDRYLQVHNATPRMLYWRGRVFEAIGDDVQAERSLWTALELAPNHERILARVERLAERKRSGARYDVYERASALPGSWLADCLHTRHLIETGNVEPALRVAHNLLASGHTSEPGMLAYLSGCIATAGRPDLAVDLVYDAFDPRIHDSRAGLNLLNACIASGRIDDAERLLRAMLIVGAPADLDELAQVEEQLRALHEQALAAEPGSGLADGHEHELAPTIDEQDIVIHHIDHPVWFEGLRMPGWLLPTKAPSTRVALLPLIVPNLAAQPDGAIPNDGWGQFSRGLLLYLHEWLELCTDADPVALMPVVRDSGLAITSLPWEPTFVQSAIAPLDDVGYVLTGSVRAGAHGVSVTIEVWNPEFDERLFAIEATEPPDRDIADLLDELRDRLAFGLGTFAGVQAGDGPAWYSHPRTGYAPQYVAAHAHLLTLAAASAGLISGRTPWGEREILHWLTHLAVTCSGGDDETAAIMQLAGLALSRSTGSLRYLEFAQQSLAIERAYGVPASRVYRRLAPLLLSVFDCSQELRARTQLLAYEFRADQPYLDWLERA